MYLVSCAVIFDTDDGILVDGPFLCGDLRQKELAEKVATDLSNDKTMPGAVVVKINEYTNKSEAIKIINKYFSNMIKNIYEQERNINR